MAMELLRQWRALKRNGYSRSDRHFLLRIIGRNRAADAVERCGWPLIRPTRPDKVVGGRGYRDSGRALAAAIAAEDWGAAVEAMEQLRGESNIRARRVFDRLPAVVRDEVRKCDCCGVYHVDADGDDHDGIGRLCDDCLGRHYFECDCGTVVHNDNSWSTPSDGACCESCFRENYCNCAGCDGVFSLSECYDAHPRGARVCESCSEEWFLWESDGLYHSRDTDPAKVRRENQGADESESAAFKWLTERVGVGVCEHVFKDEFISSDGIYVAFEKAMRVTGLTYGADDYVDGRCGPDALLDDMRAGSVDGGIPWKLGRLTFPRRIAKFFKDKMPHRKLTDAQVGAIGDAARAHCPKPTPMFWEVKAAPFDWRRGDFGDPGSCYWTCHTYARMQLNTQHNAFALRFYDSAGENRRGVGRCWVLVLGGVVVMWNAYGPIKLKEMARLIHETAGKGWSAPRDIRLTNEGGGGGWLYINHSLGIGVAPDGVTIPGAIELGWKQ